MNLFYLDTDHDKNAEYHVDSHCVKMPLEAAEMIGMAYVVNHVLGYVPRKLEPEELREVDVYRLEMQDTRVIPYPGRKAHYNHPSTIWVRSSAENLAWTYCYMNAVDDERMFRFNPTPNKARVLTNQLPYISLPDVGFTKFALAMKNMAEAQPRKIIEDNPIETYRNFYRFDKQRLAKWTKRPVPDWWET